MYGCRTLESAQLLHRATCQVKVMKVWDQFRLIINYLAFYNKNITKIFIQMLLKLCKDSTPHDSDGSALTAAASAAKREHLDPQGVR